MPQAGRVKLIAVLIVGVLIGAALGYFLAPKPAAVEEKPPEAVSKIPKKIKIGLLLDLSGPLATTGKRMEWAMQMAKEDIDAYLKSIGVDAEVEFLIEDTTINAEVALKKLQSLAAQGVKFVIGPMASSEVLSCKSFADSNKILIVSPSSTFPGLAVADDMVFRFVPTDIFQGKALARIIMDAGYKNLGIIYRKDAWGEGLMDAVKSNYEALGGNIASLVPYDPDAKDLSSEIRKLSDELKGLNDAAVLLISFETDGVMAMRAASEDPVLSQLEWFGTDGTAYMLTISEQAGDFAVKVGGFKSTIFAPTESSKFLEFKQEFNSRFGDNPDTYTCNSYDAAWVIVLSIVQVGEYDAEKVAKVFASVANNYFGVSGWTVLDENGDRVGGDYEIAAIKSVNGKFEWVRVGVYSLSSDTVQWLEG
ncbi:MAG: branched-chain amino acid ABC transporter substrate-binding protein [Candidatus Aenigmatarchaeota archaeon]|nr:MAG: branched-chain amino acid ABC transporter substrate-binding protein [Candidatus Aenigmarchaeota archaeon]